METKRDIYKDNEELELLVDFGKEGSNMFLPKGTRVNHVKSVDNENDLTKALIVAKYTDPTSKEERALIVKETDVKPIEEETVEVAFDEFNKMMMKTNPELRKFHPNLFVRWYYRAYYFFKELMNREK